MMKSRWGATQCVQLTGRATPLISYTQRGSRARDVLAPNQFLFLAHMRGVLLSHCEHLLSSGSRPLYLNVSGCSTKGQRGKDMSETATFPLCLEPSEVDESEDEKQMS